MTTPEPLWDNKRLDDLIFDTFSVDFTHDDWVFEEALKVVFLLRDDYEAERAATRARSAELEAELAEEQAVAAVANELGDILDRIEGYAHDADFEQVSLDSDTILDLTRQAALLLSMLRRGPAAGQEQQP